MAVGTTNGYLPSRRWWRHDRRLTNDTVKYVIGTRDVNSTLTVRDTGKPVT